MAQRAGSEVIPDSEDERIRLRAQERTPRATKKLPQVIEISSDSEEDASPEALPGPSNWKVATPKAVPLTPRSRKIRYIHAHKPVSISSSESEDETEHENPTQKADPLLGSPVKASHTKEVIDLTGDSSDEDEAEEEEVLDELLDTESELSKKQIVEPAPPSSKPKLKGIIRPFASSYFPTAGPSNIADKITINVKEPKSTARPNPGPSKPASSPTKPKPVVISLLSSDTSDSDLSSISRVADRTPCPLDSDDAQEGRQNDAETSRSSSSSSISPAVEKSTGKLPAGTTLAKKPRMTKKVKQAIEQARREKYALDLFEELNKVVFKDGLPKETALKWSNRLLTTAGRAKWKRSRDGTQTSEIELATKILDCDERIRNTLSHEMCHLACWIIDGDPKEGHGKVFKSWYQSHFTAEGDMHETYEYLRASKIMRRRSDIEVTTKHNYEINYPYEWECENCAKTYGRYSKSIRPEECRCGACKVGVLVPLFKVRAPRTPQRTKADSRLAAISSRDSPRSISTVIENLTRLDIEDKGSVSVNSTRGKAQPAAVDDLFGLNKSNIDTQLAALTEELGGIGIL